MRLSLPDLTKLDKYVDSPLQWLAALDIIREAMADTGLPYQEVKGEAAFYGPKIDFIIKSAIGTEYAISTNQLDFLASERFGLSYVGEDGAEHPVYVIHRAPLGSHERFVAFLIEHYGGHFPIWLAPVQAMLIPISEKSEVYARDVLAKIRDVRVFNSSFGFRAELDDSSERMQKKIRSATLQKIPLILVVGENEETTGTVAVRFRGGREIGQVPVEDLLLALNASVEERRDEAFEEQLSR
jgi:threonyl-tRNA synthetase